MSKDDVDFTGIMVQRFCPAHESDIMTRLAISESDARMVWLITASILMFSWTTSNPSFNHRLGSDDSPEMISMLLAEIGCLACFDPDGYEKAILVLAKGLTHASQVAQGKLVDPDWPFAERVAALKAQPPL